MARIRRALALGDFTSMQQGADELMQEEPANFEGYFWRGFVEVQRRNDYDAVRFLRRAEGLQANAYVLKLLSVSYYSLRQFRLFILKMNEALQTQPEDFAPYYYLGRYYASSDVADFSRASKHFRRAIELDSKHFRAYYYLGYCDELTRKLSDADREYQQSIRLAADAGAKFALPYQGMGRLRLLEDQATAALPFAERAADLAPDDAASHQVLARVYTALKRPAEAVPEWERAAALDPTDAVPYYHLFQIHSALGNKEKALSALAKFKKVSALYGK